MPNKTKLQLETEAKLELKQEQKPEEKRQHVPYILNGELYRIESQVGDNVTVKCCYCPPDRIYRGSVRSTGNFHMHIKRRHACLLGKLHEMKVAALEERRDRLFKNRNIGKPRKKSALSEAAEVAPVGETAKSHELKIKTVFQRHKQEHSEQQGQGEAASTALRASVSLDCKSESSMPDKENIKHLLQDVRNLPNLTPVLVEPFVANQVTTMVSGPTVSLLAHFKPEQFQSLPEQPEAIDLSTSSSIKSNSPPREDNMPAALARTQDLSLVHYIGDVTRPPRDMLQRLDRTLADIRQELNTRNQIEQKRLLLEAAKFKYLHPSFHFE